MTLSRKLASVMRFVNNDRSLREYWVPTNGFPADIAEIILFVLNVLKLLEKNMDSYTDPQILLLVAETYQSRRG